VEKVLALREPLLEERRGDAEALVRALVAAARHFVEPENWAANAAILARPEYLDGSAELIERAISDRLLLSRRGRIVHFPDFMFQYREAANFPWVSQAEWLYTQMVRWDGGGFDPADAARAARVFRPDIYRSALLGSAEPLPGASSKVEGSLGGTTVVGTQQGSMTLERNAFFDGRVFDPADLEGYMAKLA
jgi:NitT/TauT family transport system ATP-binding protein